MSNSNWENETASSWLGGESTAYIDSLYEDFLVNPQSIPAEWQAVFSQMTAENANQKDISHRQIREHFLAVANSKRQAVTINTTEDSKQYQVAKLINAYRTLGHHAAKLDPLEMTAKTAVPSLELNYHQLTEADLKRSFYSGTYFNTDKLPLAEIHQRLRDTYCGSIGIEYMHIADSKETEWLQQKMESSSGRPNFDAVKKREILNDLIAADGLEHYLGMRYVGQKRFSLEGGDAFIPMMKEIVSRGGNEHVKEIIIGMAHRGRLNVLINVLGKDPAVLFQEFEGKFKSQGTGDVKYHMGFSSDIKTKSGEIVHLALAFNPSHLEIINPVVEGSVRVRLERRNDLAEKNQVIPILIHGDAAFAGQGVVMETFNFSQARGYTTGGTIHIVINNQIGFTTSNPLDARSTPYCTDIAKMVQAPVLHVNGNDPEAVVFATQIAFDFRMKFKRDVVIDLMCFRRHGHNEADDPSVTQPVMYKKIKTMPPLREIFAKQLIESGLISQQEVDQLIEQYRGRLDKGEPVVDVFKENYPGKMAIDWSPYSNTKWTEKANTAISTETLNKLSKTLHKLPEGFELHPVVKKLLAEREKMSAGELPMNWGYAETMAYASLVNEGYNVRLSGQDSGRGTFAHRHAVLHDNQTGNTFIPLEAAAKNANQSFVVIDSVLSEEAVLAFEYGYASSEPSALVLWEAQFGDFANGAQVVIDQFISSGEQKWGRLCGLVMLLPHGYEGQGPEHSSARLERYLQLCAQHNIQVCTPTTPAQIFHVLRRQMLRNYRKPLIIMTPKSILRHKLAVSTIADLTEGQFYPVIAESDKLNADKVTRIVLCAGKVYYDLVQKRRDEQLNQVAILRIEQLYPFPEELLIKELTAYSKAKEVIWCQEEPKNQGAWFATKHHIENCLRTDQTLRYAGRDFAAAPAVGSSIMHAAQQQELIKQALMD